MPHPSPRLVLLACLLGLGLGAPARAAPAVLTPERAGTAVAGDVRLAQGTWRVADPEGVGALRITQDGTVLDLRGAALVGAAEERAADRFEGVGILVEGARDVTIRGGIVRGYRLGVKAVDAPGLVIEGLDASENRRQRLGSTPAREAAADWLWPHENDRGEWEAKYGAGLSLTGCRRATVRRCRVRDGQNGLLLTRCERCVVVHNDFSFNSGWGIALYRSQRCQVNRNRCDWCVRGYSHGVYHRGQDSAGILVFEQSSHNLFVGNSATHSGDGFFLYAGHETTQKTGRGGCNDNLVFDNDFSHAVANGIEATFSTRNTFVRNDCSDCDHGIWAGYSSDSLFAGNRIHDCTTAGISIEHGQHNRIMHNEIRAARVGVHLWWDHDAAFVDGAFGRHRDTSSSDNVVVGNDIAGGGTALRLLRDTGATVRWNQLHGREVCLELGAGTLPAAVEHNQFRGTRLPARTPPLAVLDATGGSWALPAANTRRGRLRGSGAADPGKLPTSLLLVRPPARLPETPRGAGGDHPPARLPEDMPRGRAQILVGPWGPLDPRSPHAFPSEIRALGDRAEVRLGGRGRWRVGATRGRVLVEPAGGTLPATVRLRVAPVPGDAPDSGLVTFAVDFDLAGARRTVRGHLLEARWTVRWWTWSTDPRENEEAWRALLAARPARTVTVSALDFPWGGGGPAGVARDRFATVATTVIRLDAGRYRLRTVSDDGVRVSVDGKRVLENWTHHAPTEDAVVLDLAAGNHAVQVEHFEIDGWAHLRFSMEPVTP